MTQERRNCDTNDTDGRSPSLEHSDFYLDFIFDNRAFLAFATIFHRRALQAIMSPDESPMTTAIQHELAEHPELIYRHSVDEYHTMIANGSIVEGQPFELLDGQIVRKIRSASGQDFRTVGVEHALIVMRLAKLSTTFGSHGCHLRAQQPISVPPRDEPEPDAAIIRGSIEDYADHHPRSADVLCVIEVADSSISRDRGYKLSLYANAGIPMYVIVNLDDRAVEIYKTPVIGEGRFAEITLPARGENVSFPTTAGETVSVPVQQMFL